MWREDELGPVCRVPGGIRWVFSRDKRMASQPANARSFLKKTLYKECYSQVVKKRFGPRDQQHEWDWSHKLLSGSASPPWSSVLEDSLAMLQPQRHLTLQFHLCFTSVFSLVLSSSCPFGPCELSHWSAFGQRAISTLCRKAVMRSFQDLFACADEGDEMPV